MRGCDVWMWCVCMYVCVCVCMCVCVCVLDRFFSPAYHLFFFFFLSFSLPPNPFSLLPSSPFFLSLFSTLGSPSAHAPRVLPWPRGHTERAQSGQHFDRRQAVHMESGHAYNAHAGDAWPAAGREQAHCPHLHVLPQGWDMLRKQWAFFLFLFFLFFKSVFSFALWIVTSKKILSAYW